MAISATVRSVLTSVLVAAVTVGATLLPLPETAVRFSAKTVLVVPGNDNPTGAAMEAKLNDYLNPGSPNYGFPGYELWKVPWVADSFDGDPGYTVSQNDGLHHLRAAISQFRDVDDEDDVDRIAVVGYSSGALVVIREMKALDGLSEDVLASDQIQFLVFGSPQRPNGGIYTRFPGFTFGDIVFEEPNPDTRFELTDISYEYDPISDFPAFPLLPLTLVNAALGFHYLHVTYVGPDSDLGNVVDNPTMTYYDQARGIRYLTIRSPHLPLLMPLYQLIDAAPVLRPLIEPMLKLVEPTLKVLVDLGYNRDVPVGEHLPARLLPTHDPAKVLANLANSAVEGVNGAWASITGIPAPNTSGTSDTSSTQDRAAPPADHVTREHHTIAAPPDDTADAQPEKATPDTDPVDSVAERPQRSLKNTTDPDRPSRRSQTAAADSHLRDKPHKVRDGSGAKMDAVKAPRESKRPKTADAA
ncbi:MAG: PE-PPE domain-containing protein [Mycobacterium sp.]